MLSVTYSSPAMGAKTPGTQAGTLVSEAHMGRVPKQVLPKPEQLARTQARRTLSGHRKVRLPLQKQGPATHGARITAAGNPWQTQAKQFSP